MAMTEDFATRLLQPTSLLSYVSNCDLTDSSMEESFPSNCQPKPSQVTKHDSLSSVMDPSLLITPERRPPTVVQLRSATSPSPLFDVESFAGRTTRVHFDQNVAVHHISPECSSSISSRDGSHVTLMDSNSCSDLICEDLDLTNLSNIEPLSILASDLKSLPAQFTDKLNSCAGSCSQTKYDTLQLNSRGYNKKTDITGTSTQGDILRPSRHSPCSPDFEQLCTKPAYGQKFSVELSGRKSQLNPLVVSETGISDGLPLSDAVKLLTPSSDVDCQCILARPEFNSTLRINREIEQLKGQQFDLSVVTEKINPKLKSKVVEKAYIKLNAETDLYPDLIGIEVSESDLLSRLADEKMSRVRGSDAAVREKAEDKISRIPDIMDFFTSDLHKESASVSVIGISALRPEPHTAELNHAFDLYRHIRTWERL